MAEAISGKGVGGLRCNSSYLGSARRENLKTIWESGAQTKTMWDWWWVDDQIFKDWAHFQQFLKKV